MRRCDGWRRAEEQGEPTRAPSSGRCGEPILMVCWSRGRVRTEAHLDTMGDGHGCGGASARGLPGARMLGRWLEEVEDSEVKLLVQGIEIWWGGLPAIEKGAKLVRMAAIVDGELGLSPEVGDSAGYGRESAEEVVRLL